MFLTLGRNIGVCSSTQVENLSLFLFFFPSPSLTFSLFSSRGDNRDDSHEAVSGEATE